MQIGQALEWYYVAFCKKFKKEETSVIEGVFVVKQSDSSHSDPVDFAEYFHTTSCTHTLENVFLSEIYFKISLLLIDCSCKHTPHWTNNWISKLYIMSVWVAIRSVTDAASVVVTLPTDVALWKQQRKWL